MVSENQSRGSESPESILNPKIIWGQKYLNPKILFWGQKKFRWYFEKVFWGCRFPLRHSPKGNAGGTGIPKKTRLVPLVDKLIPATANRLYIIIKSQQQQILNPVLYLVTLVDFDPFWFLVRIKASNQRYCTVHSTVRKPIVQYSTVRELIWMPWCLES